VITNPTPLGCSAKPPKQVIPKLSFNTANACGTDEEWGGIWRKQANGWKSQLAPDTLRRRERYRSFKASKKFRTRHLSPVLNQQINRREVKALAVDALLSLAF
jgi:hypothetical protein